MSTYAQMQAKIADDLNRADLTSQIQREINRAIRKYASKPMWFSSTTANFTTANGQWTYGVTDGIPSDIRIVDYVRVNQSVPTITTTTGVADVYILTPSPPITVYGNDDSFFVKISVTNTGASTIDISGLGAVAIARPNGVAMQPGDLRAGQVYTIKYNSSAAAFFLQEVGGTYYDIDEWAIDRIIRSNVNDNPGLTLSYGWFNQQFYFYPIPDQVYIVQVFYEKYYADLVAPTDSNDFTNNPETEQLIEQEVEYQLYDTVILDPIMAAKCKANRDEALKICKTITSNFNGVHGYIRATTF